MPVLSHLHHLFNAELCQTYIRSLRWKDRPLQCPRCESHHIGQWGTYQYRPGCKRYWCHRVAIGRALQPFPRSKRSRHVSAHSAFQLGLLTLEGRIRRCRRRGAPASKGRHLPSSLCPLTSFLTGLP